MSIAREFEGELFRGVADGHREAGNEFVRSANALGMEKPDYNSLRTLKPYVGALPDHVLGVTNVRPDGRATDVTINKYIANLGLRLYEKGKLSYEKAKNFVYKMGKMTTKHEYMHVFSAPIVRNEVITDKERDAMESLATYGLSKVLKENGKNDEADFVEKTNPYPRAWRLGKIADWADYTSEDRRYNGYAGFVRDSEDMKIYKTYWKLGKAATKKAGKSLMPEFKPKFAYAS